MDGRAAYGAALGLRDRGRALEVAEEFLADGWTTSEIIEHLVVPSQHRIGDLWLAGALSISDEHAATAISAAVVERLAQSSPATGSGPPVVVACADPEEHLLAAAVIAAALGALGCATHLLPGSVSGPELVREVAGLEPRAVLLSATVTSALTGCRQVLSGLAELSVPVVVGGRAWGRDGRRARLLGATAYAASAGDALQVLDVLPTRGPADHPRPHPSDSVAEAEDVMRGRFALADQLSPRLLATVDGADGQVPAWWPDLAAQLDHVVGCLAASLVVEDPTVLREVDAWLATLLSSRCDDVHVATTLWGLLAELVAEPFPGARTALADAGLVAAQDRSG